MISTEKRSTEFAGASHVFLLVQDLESRDVEKVLTTLADELSRLGMRSDSVVRLTCFLADETQLADTYSQLVEFFGQHYPASEVLVQPPLSGASVSALVWAVSGETVEVSRPEANMTLMRQTDLELLFLGEIRPTLPGADFQHQFSECFDKFQERLAAAGSDYSQVIKTWSYYGDVETSGNRTEVFQAFNRARAAFFEPLQFDKYLVPPGERRYPANTGVGDGRSVALSGIACNSCADALLIPLENPMQTPASGYPKERGPTALLFARGMAVVSQSDVLVFVSGMVSVVGATTTDTSSAPGQASQILQIIDTLLSSENLAKSGAPVVSGGLETLIHCVLFLKEREAFADVKRVVDREVPRQVPVMYVEAGLSRDDFLVEIEGMASMKLGAQIDLGEAARATRAGALSSSDAVATFKSMGAELRPSRDR